MKRSPWFPVWAGFQDDEQFLAVSAEAELLYFRATARCKGLDQGTTGGDVGRHQLRRLCDKMSAPPADLAGELVDVGLWVETPTGWHIPAYGEWNTSAEEERDAKAEHGKRGNHARWKHPGPFEACPTCHPPVSPGESGATPPGVRLESGSESPRSPQPSLDVDETRRDVDETTPPSPPPAGLAPDAAELARLVGLTDDLIETLGIVGAVANEGERKLVARALARGWSETQLLEESYDVAGRDDIDSPRRYLGRILRRLANTDPPSVTVTALPADGRRGALHDERTPCLTCDGSGMVGGLGPDGRPEAVRPCPDCHVLGATA